MNRAPGSQTRSGTAAVGPDDGRISVGSLLGGRYRLESRIGAGGMATIFRARDESLDREVAVKVLHAHLADDEGLLERFRTEARHVAALLHPNIVNVFDQGVAELPYIVMEYVDGPSLREILNERGRLRPGEALAVVEPVCTALARAHASGVVHRDVKPENVLIASDGTAKVADFGIARALAATSHTTAGTLIGSVHYLAPELVNGAEATARSDQYSVGVLLFELLTGRKPLPADSPTAVALRHAREPIPAPSAYVSDCPRTLDKVVARATAVDPGKRYPDLRALAAAVHAAVPGGPSPLTVRRADDGREHTLVIPADAQETMSVDVAAEVELRRARRPRRRPASESGPRRAAGPHTPRTGRRLPVPLLALLMLGLLGGGGFALWNWGLAPVRDVPVLYRLPEADAAALLAERGLRLAVADTETSPDIPQGAVLAQDPQAGADLRRGGTVSVVLSEGPATVAMPAVVGLTGEEARALLEAAPYHFRVRVDQSFHDEVPAGVVIAQAPNPEESLRQGDAAIINVSLGIEQVTVPDLAGRSRGEAEQLLAANKLRAAFEQRYSDEAPRAGTVIAQDIPGGTTVDKDTTVTVTVSAGPVTITLPDVEGRSIDEARTQLAGLGLRVNVIEQPRPRIGPFRRGDFGRVEYQTPRPGEPIRRGERVDLYTFAESAERQNDG